MQTGLVAALPKMLVKPRAEMPRFGAKPKVSEAPGSLPGPIPGTDQLDLSKQVAGPDKTSLVDSEWIVPPIDQPLFQWVDGASQRQRKRVDVPLLPNRSYDLVDPLVSESLLIRTPQDLSPAHLQHLQKAVNKLGVVNIPLADPRSHSENIGRYRIPWLRKQYNDSELAVLAKQGLNRRDQSVLTYITSMSAAYKHIYSNFWWLRDSETVAYALSNSQHPDAAMRKQERKLGARLTLSNLSYYVSRPHNIFTARAYDSQGPLAILGGVRVLIDDTVRDQLRQGPWRGINDHTIHIRERTVGDRLDESWPQLQFDALGLHLMAVSKQLKSRDGFRWDALNPQEKEAVTVLFGYMLRLKYWDTPDSGAWEFDHDGRSIRSSSVAMATAGMQEFQKLLFSPKGQPIRQWMIHYLETRVLPLVASEKRQGFRQELIAPLQSEQTFEAAAVAPGFRRLYHQLPFESFNGINPDQLDSEDNLYRPYDPKTNAGRWDAATLFIPRFAPKLLDDMPRMKATYFPTATVPRTLAEIRQQYSETQNAPIRGDAVDVTQILNSNEALLRRQSGIIRYEADAYQNLKLQPNTPGPYNGHVGSEPEWSNFPPMQATAWLKRYLESKNTADLMRGIDMWNLSVSSLARYKDIRDGRTRVHWAESVRPHPEAGSRTIAASLIPDLQWSHAEAKSMWEALQQALCLYHQQGKP